MEETLSYPELGIQIHTGPGRDTTTDIVHFRSGQTNFVLENSLAHQPSGIRVTAATLGIKASHKPDFTVCILPKRAAAAGVFTRSTTASVTIHRNRQVLQDGRLQALAVNSGNANVFTPTDKADLQKMAKIISSEFGVAENDLLICSTGVIGKPLPMEKFEKGIPGLRNQLKDDNLDAAARAILTTDLGPKTVSFRSGDFVLCGFAKGAGMIEPNMATMLVYFFTNAALPPEFLDSALREAVEHSFHGISIDTDTSTSDSVALFSTGELHLDSEQQNLFRSALTALSVKLARDIISQGEGVSKTIEVRVASNLSVKESRRLAKKIINSPLVKAAVHGNDPNWGRIVAAIGKPDDASPPGVLPALAYEELTISLQGREVYKGGKALALDLPALSLAMKEQKLVQIDILLGDGKYVSRAWGCDLTEEYVKFNSDYTS